MKEKRCLKVEGTQKDPTEYNLLDLHISSKGPPASSYIITYKIVQQWKEELKSFVP